MDNEYIWPIATIILILISILSLSIIFHHQNETDNESIVLKDCQKEVEVWQNRALKNVDIMHAYCDELTAQYKYVIFNMSDCSIYQPNGLEYQQVICEKEKPLFVQTQE